MVRILTESRCAFLFYSSAIPANLRLRSSGRRQYELRATNYSKGFLVMKNTIRRVARAFVPKQYRPRVKNWIYSLMGGAPAAALQEMAPVYCGNHRIMANHSNMGFMYLDSTDLTVTPGVIMNRYERHVTSALEALVKPGFVVVEGGANQGFHTLTMASLVSPNGRILSFEPDPRNLAVLRDNIRAHCLDAIVTVIPKAAYHENTSISFYCAKSGAQSSVFLLQADTGPWVSCYDPPEDSRIEVEGVTISSVLAEYGLVPDLVRLDVEGAELMALDGMWEHLENRHDIIIVFEYNPWCIKQGWYTTPEDFIRRLSDLGMKFWRIAEFGAFIPSTPAQILAIEDMALSDFVACRSPKLIGHPR